MTRRSVLYKEAGVTRFADLRAAEERRHLPLPRILCVIDEFQVLLAGTDRLAAEAVALLESVARKGRSYGIHLILASQTVRGVEALYAKRDSIFGQFPVRIALPGGGDVLDRRTTPRPGCGWARPWSTPPAGSAGRAAPPAGTSASSLPGSARRAETRLSDLRHRLWQARAGGRRRRSIFEGYAHQHLADDPTYQAALAGRAARPPSSSGARSTCRCPPPRSRWTPRPAGTLPFSVPARSAPTCSTPRRAAWPHTRRAPPGSWSPRWSPRRRTRRGPRGRARRPPRGRRRRLCRPGGRARLEEPGYLVVFGMDAASAGRARRPAARAAARRPGPRRAPDRLVAGVAPVQRGHRRQRRPGRRGRPGLPQRSATGVSLFLGQKVDWQPRPNRALLHDRHADRTVVIVPFVRPGERRQDRPTGARRS